MRRTFDLFLLSGGVFIIALATRRLFFWDIMPISWDYESPHSGALEIAFLLLSIQNMAAIVAAIALALLCVLIIKRRANLPRPASRV